MLYIKYENEKYKNMKLLVFVTLVSLSFAWQSYAPGEGPFDHMSNEEFASTVI